MPPARVASSVWAAAIRAVLGCLGVVANAQTPTSGHPILGSGWIASDQVRFGGSGQTTSDQVEVLRQDDVMDEVTRRKSEPARKQRGPVSVWAHGAGSSATFLSRAFPPDRLGMADSVYLDDRTADVSVIEAALRREVEASPGRVVLGGVSIGAHAAARLLSDPPDNVIGAMLCLPAWSGPAAYIAGLTATAAEAIDRLGIAGVLEELPKDDWVTRELADAWSERTDEELVAELELAALQPGPSAEQLRSIAVPVGIVRMTDDPLHPASVSAQWGREIPRSNVQSLSRDEPGKDLTVFADAARAALRAAFSTSEPTGA